MASDDFIGSRSDAVNTRLRASGRDRSPGAAAGPGLPASVELARIAVYDPGLPIFGRPSFDFSPDFERSVRTGEYAWAMTVMSRRQRAV